MTIRELYIGGTTTQNVNRSVFPSNAFSATAVEQLASKPAAHKGSISFGLTRVLDFQNDSSLVAYVKAQAAAGTPIIAGDRISLGVIPPNMLFFGISAQVLQAAPGTLALTPSTRVGGMTFPAIAAGAAGLMQFASPNATVWATDGDSPLGSSGGSVTGTTVVGGAGYTSAPTVAFGAPPAGGVQATGTANISGGVVTSITLTNAGSGYTAAPAVTFTGGGFTTAATASSTVSAIVTTSGLVFNQNPDVLDLTVGTLPTGGIGNLILAVTPILLSCNINGYPY